jgi:rhamnogalacturonan endolyase
MKKLTLFAATAMLIFAIPAITAQSVNPITINTTSSTCGGRTAGSVWEINNGALDICFYLAHASIIDMTPDGTTDNFVDQTQASGGIPKGFYMDNAGFGTPAGVPGYDLTDKYLDWWVTYPSGKGNNFTYSEHWIVTPYDSGVHVYFVADHATTDATGSIGQVQWVFRLDLAKFNNLYLANEDLSNPDPVKPGPMPTYAEYFGTVNPDGLGAADPGRAVQDATVDMHGYGTGPWSAFPPISPTFGRQFGDKYDYSGYSYLNLCHGVYGSQYGAWVVFPSNESLVGGPTKQMLLFTGNLNMIEAFSNHLDNSISDITPSGTASHRLFGPFYVRFNRIGGRIHTADDMYLDAITAGTAGGRFFHGHEGRGPSSEIVRSEDHGQDWNDHPTFDGDGGHMRFSYLYDHETDLLAAGYLPTGQRGDVHVQVRGIWGAPKSAWAVLSDPAKNFQYSTGAQYWIDISHDGSGTFHHVMPGTYRLSVYDLGHWGELRQENVVVTAGQEVVVPTLNFVRENFGDKVWTIGIPDRSSHEFLHGHDAMGHDDREYWGDWNYWSDFQANQGAVVYNATSGPAGPATNDLSKWNYNHWKTFNPGLFGGYFCNPSDDTKDGYTCIVPSYVATLPGTSGTNGVNTPTPPWTVNFATPTDISDYTANGYVVLSVSLAATEASYIVNLNGQQLIWSNVNKSDAAVRSGLSGYTQWIAFQWPASALKPAGENNVLAIGVSQPQGDEDDALRLELTNTSAAPSARGWNDYSFVTAGATGGSVTVSPNDALPNP